MTTNGKGPHDPLDIFIKLMMMTTSSNDGEALNALRMANSHLKTKIGSDWNELIRGKVKVEADPFAAAPMPTFATKPMTAGGSASQPTSPPPPPKVFDDAKEIEGFIDTLMLRGRMPQSIVARLKAIEATWRQQGRLMYADYNFLKTQAKSRKRY